MTYVPGDKSELKPGAKIFIAAANKKDDGTLEAGSSRSAATASRRRCEQLTGGRVRAVLGGGTHQFSEDAT